MKYVIGLAFNAQHNKVLLQLKKKGPQFNIGFLNPPGGKVEQNPTPEDLRYESFNGAMRREFKEETGLDSEQGDWLRFHLERHQSGAELHCYVTDKLPIWSAQTTTIEPNVVVELVFGRNDWVAPYGYVWCPNADGVSPTGAEYSEQIEVQTRKPNGGLAYYMNYMLPMALSYLEHPEHRYLEG